MDDKKTNGPEEVLTTECKEELSNGRGDDE